MHPEDMHQTSGFTLFELVIVLAIAGILAAIAIPSFQSAFANQEVKSFTQKLLLSLSQARAEAIKYNGTCQVSVQPVDVNDWTQGWFVIADEPDTAAPDTCNDDPQPGTAFSAGSPTDARVILQHPTNDAGLTIAGAPTAPILYNRNGRIAGTAAGLTFTVCDAGGRALQRTLTTSIGGMPDIAVGDNC